MQYSITATNKENTLRACSVPDTPSKRAPIADSKYGPPCLATAKLRSAKADVEVSWDGETVNNGKSSDIIDALFQLQKNVAEDPNCDAIALLAKSGDAVVGVWVGRQIQKASAAGLFESFIEMIQSRESALPKKAAAQICAPASKKPTSQSFGVFYDATGKIDDVFSAIQGWSRGNCLSALGQTETWAEQNLSIIPASALSMGADNALAGVGNSTYTNSTSSLTVSKATSSAASQSPATSPSASVEAVKVTDKELVSRDECHAVKIEPTDSCHSIATQKCGIKLQDLYKFNGGDSQFCNKLQAGSFACCSEGAKPQRRMALMASECKYVQVEQDDTCWSIAQECGITEKKLYEYNGGSDAFCNNLKLRSAVCCSSGDKPDLKPKDNADGSCSVYVVQKEDVCFSIADQHLLTVTELINFNKGKTWGWGGCDTIQPLQKICVSGGSPPMPAAIENAQCGPQKPGTERPKSGNITDLNPCPLNVCCNIWGQCGTTKDFCIDTKVDNTPGTAKNGTYGCISNCGMDIVNNKVGPAKFQTLAYFEGWNFNRPCLNMDVEDIPDGNDIIHFAFGWISEDFQISAGADVKEQFDKFVKMKSGFKKVISFGGWAFSNEPATSHIIRNAVKPENAVKFATNVVNFVTSNGLDGVDFDWEYPGADDIEGSQPGTPEDGKNYLAFLQLVKRRLPSGKTLAIAAPASYWYLKGFPIDDISKVVDYIVYMTYDLHGQWDVGNKWASDGCEGGNCLRSHINSTLTHSSLSMITKAGVPSNKIFVGVSSYGRSFKMSKFGCEGPDCTFLGGRNDSPAKHGRCTDTGGYIADAEMMQIMNLADQGFDGSEYHTYWDEESDSDIFVYDEVEWVSWMSPVTKDRRKGEYKGLNMAGTTDWAIDLGRDVGTSNKETSELDWDLMDLTFDCKFETTYSSLDDLDKASGDMHPICASMHAIEVLGEMLKHSLDGYDAAADGYDGLFDFYKDYIIKTLEGRLVNIMLASKEDGGRGDEFFNCFAVQGGIYAKRSDASKATCSDLPEGQPLDDYVYWFELKDKEGWEKALGEEGILAEWIKYDLREVKDDGGCQPQGTSICLYKNTYFHDFPVPIEHSKIEVPDPKEIIKMARENMDNITSTFDDVFISIGLEDWNEGYENAVEVLSVPVFMLEDAVASMKEVKDIGKDWKEEQEKNLILKIIEGVLFLLAFVGPIVGTLGRVGGAIARLVSALEGAAGVGLGIYSIIEDPTTAPLAILMMVMGELGGAAGKRGQFAGLNKKKNDMTSKEKDNMGASYSKNTPKVQSIMGKSCGKK
ncbi:killer toxin subunits alpha/beta [Colletotrichum karsti]|uniref:chitinase n=1 Tax=Colletotrichum karsti TaxID=1095194 RepID=A0A9P6LMF9_9PEZI|nr:killer toxin subunits alpha/beta [Colletotrichum karsti]KAF9881459.1 killer toxin subunits alpha/beta [Colletotrichum karsti]